MKKFYYAFADPEEYETDEGYTAIYLVEQEFYNKENRVSDNHITEEVLKSLPEELRDSFEDIFDEVMESLFESSLTEDEVKEYFSYLSCFEEHPLD